jgi:hypothetical protein
LLLGLVVSSATIEHRSLRRPWAIGFVKAEFGPTGPNSHGLEMIFASITLQNNYNLVPQSWTDDYQ